MGKEVLGHIDCPTCGTAKGMRITADRNGDPFGYCEATCSQQLRVGGDKSRVAAFLARFPWAAGKPAAPPVSVTAPAPEKAPEPKPKAPPKAKAAPVPEPVPTPAAPAPFDPFGFLKK